MKYILLFLFLVCAVPAFGQGASQDGSYNVKAYGAKCDGVTDDVTAINAAITAAGTGGVVELPVGTCAITTPVIIPFGMTFRGQGRGRSILTTTADITMLNVTNAGVDMTDLAIIDLTLRSTNGAPTTASRGITFANTHREFYTQVRRIRIIGTYYGMRVNGSGGNIKQFMTVADSFLGENQDPLMQYGIFMDTEGTGTAITNNIFGFLPAPTGTAVGYHAEGVSFGDTVIVGNQFEGGAKSIQLTCLTPFTSCVNFVVVGNKFDSATKNIVLTHILFSRFQGNNGAYNAEIEADVSSTGNIYDLNVGQGLSFGDVAKINDATLGPLYLRGKSTTGNVVADFAAGINTANEKSCLRLRTDNPAYFWDVCTEDLAGGGTTNGLAFRQRNNEADAITVRKVYLDSTGEVYVNALKTVGAATGKMVVCVDTDGKLYRSNSGTECVSP